MLSESLLNNGQPLRFSIALAAYNGEKYLPAQLDSFAGQTVPPFEVVVCDDSANHATEAVVRRFAENARFSVNYFRNNPSLGIMRNFDRAVGLCSGEIIVLSDQDDVWLPKKLERHQDVYLERPEVGMVFSDGTVVEADLSPNGATLYGHTGLRSSRLRAINRGRAFRLFARRSFVYGCTLSFRSSLRQLVLPFSMDHMHDVWIQNVLSACSVLQGLSEPLILYRRHDAQSVGIKPAKLPSNSSLGQTEDLDRQIRAVNVLRRRLDDCQASVRFHGIDQILDAKLAYLRRRLRVRGPFVTGTLSLALGLLSGAYVRYGAYPKKELLEDMRILMSRE